MDYNIIGHRSIQLVSLTFDGLTGAVQDRMRAEHHVQSHHMMFNMNLWSIGILAISKLHLCVLIIQGIFMQGCQGWHSAAESTRPHQCYLRQKYLGHVSLMMYFPPPL